VVSKTGTANNSNPTQELYKLKQLVFSKLSQELVIVVSKI
jgi:hypothetical protein